ncbi:unannotated protein [freshwater metagenome]|uniref:Unannotated protein n=1 Tax=freshwater metagenome TaxID=449393 RepID=A0A6J7XS41_9ZZZZ
MLTGTLDAKFADQISTAAWTSFLAQSGKLLYVTLNVDLATPTADFGRGVVVVTGFVPAYIWPHCVPGIFRKRACAEGALSKDPTRAARITATRRCLKWMARISANTTKMR